MKFLRRLRADLEALGEQCLVLGNFYCGPSRTQIDFVVVTARGATVVELKGYGLPVEGGVNGHWKSMLPDGGRRVIASKNPFQQAIDARYAVIDELTKEMTLDSAHAKQAVGANLCLFFEPLPGCDIPNSNFKCHVGGYRQLCSQIHDSLAGPLSLDTWREFASRAGLVRRLDAVEQTEAERFAADYASQWQATIAAASKPFVAVSLVVEGRNRSLCECVERLQEGRNLLIVGDSGSGKSRVLEELSTLTASAGMLPIAIEARIFEGDLRPLLERSVALASTFSVKDVLRNSRRTANPAVVFVDGLNECQPKLQAHLLRALFALHRRYGLQLVVVSQREVPVPWLPNDVACMPEATRSHLRAVLEAHLSRAAKPEELVALEVIASAHDAEILAGVMIEESGLDGRFSLYSAFTRQRLETYAGVGHRALAKIAGTIRERFASTISEHELVRELTAVLDSAGEAEQVWRAARKCGLVVVRSGRVFFRHDLIADYFCTVFLLEQCRDVQQLAEALRRPIYEPLLEFAVGGCGSASGLDTLLGSSPIELLIACIDSKCGARAKSLVLDRVRDALDTAVEDYEKLVLEFSTGEDGHHHVSICLSDGVESRTYGNYLAVVPHALCHGLLPDVLDAFSRIDRRIWNEAERLRAENSNVNIAFRRRGYNAVYSPPGSFVFSAMHEIQQGFMSLCRNSESPALNEVLWSQLSAHNELRPGQLLIIVGMMNRLEPVVDCIPHDFVDIIRHLWDAGVGRLRLEVVELVRRTGPLLDNDGQDELRALLDSWLTDDDPLTNSLVFDAFQGVGGPETDLSVESVHQEFIAALEMPRSQLASERAMHMYVCTFDHPCDDLYVEAYHELLTEAQRRELLTRAAYATYSDLTTSMVIRELARSPVPEAAACFQRFARVPDLSGTWAQSAVETYLLSIGALAGMGLSLANLEDTSPKKSAWPVAAELLYCLASQSSPSKNQQEARLWEQLANCGVAEAFDIVMHVERSFSSFDKERKISFLPVCANGVRRLSRAVLAKEYQPATEFARLAQWHDLMTKHRTFALDVLGLVGRKTDLEVVRTWVEDVTLGRHAIAAAKALESSNWVAL
ncbi:NERD domain-containing protein [Burkholderia sp. PU8-34]